MTEKRLKELTAGQSLRSLHSAGLQPHEPPNRRPYERPRTESYASEPCLLLAGSITEFGGTHGDATSNMFGGMHLGNSTGMFGGSHQGNFTGQFGGTHLGNSTGQFGGTHLGNSTGMFGGTHLDIQIAGVWE